MCTPIKIEPLVKMNHFPKFGPIIIVLTAQAIVQKTSIQTLFPLTILFPSHTLIPHNLSNLSTVLDR